MGINLNLDKFAEKYGYKKAILLFIFLSLLLANFFSFQFGKSQINNSVSSQSKTEVNINSTSSTKQAVEGTKDDSKAFDPSSSDWKLNQYHLSDEYNCPNFFSGYPAPEIWYNKPIPVLFQSINIRYLIRNGDVNSLRPPSFVFSFGKSPRIFRFYLPQENPQSVGFEKFYDGGTTSKRLAGKDLEDPISTTSPIELTIRTQLKKEDEVIYTFNVKYISSVTKNPIEDVFSYDLNLEDPDPKNATAEIGIATFKSSCIKPLTYKIES